MIGELFSGYGGLGLGVQAVLGGEVAWHAEIDPGASKVLAARFPDVPNLGDVTRVDWTQVQPVDVLCAGFPCQDISNAGKRAGIEGERSGLWREVVRAVRVLRPGLVVVENVNALLSGKSEFYEPNDRCLCGWPYRRRRLHNDLLNWTLLSRADRCWDGGEGTTRTRGATSKIRGHDSSDSRSDGSVGRSGCMDGPGSCGGAGTDAAGTSPDPKRGAGAHRSAGRRNGCGTAEDTEWTGDMGQQYPCSLRDPEDAHARTEPEGAIDPFTGEPTAVCPSCGRLLGDGPGRDVLRSWFGTVLGDLAEVGYDARWVCLPASAAGAPHRRERVFVVAADASGERHGGSSVGFGAGRLGRVDGTDGSQAREREWAREKPRGRSAAAAADAGGVRPERPRGARGRGRGPADDYRPATDTDLTGSQGAEPAAGRDLPARGAPPDADGNGLPRVAGLPAGRDALHGDVRGHADRRGTVVAWGAYTPAIRQWEAVLGRPAPPPTEPGRNGPRLSPRLVEWMMGLPDGWVTDLLPRNQALKALGNGVVPAQAALAVRLLLTDTMAGAA